MSSSCVTLDLLFQLLLLDFGDSSVTTDFLGSGSLRLTRAHSLKRHSYPSSTANLALFCCLFSSVKMYLQLWKTSSGAEGNFLFESPRPVGEVDLGQMSIFCQLDLFDEFLAHSDLLSCW